MFIFLSKLLPLFIYPTGLACLLVILAIILRGKKRLQLFLLIGTFITIWVGGNKWVAMSLARSLEWRYLPMIDIPNADVIVVLGGGTESAQPPRQMVEVNSAGDRILYAAKLYKQGKAPHILLSGGNISFLGTRESTPASEMFDLMQFVGIPPEAIWLQNQSQNTHEDALYCQEILAQKGIKRILLVTSAMHMPRSVALFEHNGLQVIPAPTDFTVTYQNWADLTKPDLKAQLINLIPNSSDMAIITNALKEYIGMFVYRLQGWI
jgi:uncharacterized SAM-binding protein YcdF (DUF218 family)